MVARASYSCREVGLGSRAHRRGSRRPLDPPSFVLAPRRGWSRATGLPHLTPRSAPTLCSPLSLSSALIKPHAPFCIDGAIDSSRDAAACTQNAPLATRQSHRAGRPRRAVVGNRGPRRRPPRTSEACPSRRTSWRDVARSQRRAPKRRRGPPRARRDARGAPAASRGLKSGGRRLQRDVARAASRRDFFQTRHREAFLERSCIHAGELGDWGDDLRVLSAGQRRARARAPGPGAPQEAQRASAARGAAREDAVKTKEIAVALNYRNKRSGSETIGVLAPFVAVRPGAASSRTGRRRA